MIRQFPVKSAVPFYNALYAFAGWLSTSGKLEMRSWNDGTHDRYVDIDHGRSLVSSASYVLLWRTHAPPLRTLVRRIQENPGFDMLGGLMVLDVEGRALDFRVGPGLMLWARIVAAGEVPERGDTCYGCDLEWSAIKCRIESDRLAFCFGCSSYLREFWRAI